MSAIPLLAGMGATEAGDFSERLPINLEPVPTDTGLSKGYLRTAMGARQVGVGPDKDRGGIVWNNTHYRAMGNSLVTVSPTGTVTNVATIVDDGSPVTFDYGFGRLATRSSTTLYLYDGATNTAVTDPDLGPVRDMLWMDGYFVTTDGTSIVVTDLANPFAVNPLKYGSAEADPDMITGLGRLRDELIAFGSNTIEFYTNVGSSGFPFQVNPGATIPVGCVGPYAKCPFVQTYAFVGGGRNQAVGVWLVGGGTATKISTRVIDDMLAAEENQAGIELEARVARDENRLYVHMTDKTLVYLAAASATSGQAIWYIVQSGEGSAYRLRHAVEFYGKWFVGDTESNAIGVLAEDIDPGDNHSIFMSFTKDGETYSQERPLAVPALGQRNRRMQWRPHVRFNSQFLGLRFRGTSGQTHFGSRTDWFFQTPLIYNKGQGGIVHDLELMGLPGRTGYGFSSLEARIEGLGV